jgi:hypothetical protein
MLLWADGTVDGSVVLHTGRAVTTTERRYILAHVMTDTTRNGIRVHSSKKHVTMFEAINDLGRLASSLSFR